MFNHFQPIPMMFNELGPFQTILIHFEPLWTLLDNFGSFMAFWAILFSDLIKNIPEIKRNLLIALFSVTSSQESFPINL